SMPAISPRLPEQIDAVDKVARAVASEVPEVAAAASAEKPVVFESPDHFVSELMPFAEQIGRESGIDPRLMIAQAALETGWGKHMIKGDDSQPSFNLFGIKADGRWGGDAVTITTRRFRGGVGVKVRADFGDYPDYEASCRGDSDCLQCDLRYRDVRASAGEPEVFAEKLQEAGYATELE